MKKTISLVAALLGALLFAVPAFAQTSEARPGGMVTLTLRLAVEGDVPGWQHFAVEYYPAGGHPGQVPLCTTAADEGAAGPMCVGGNSYTASVRVPAGDPVTVRFLRHDTRTAPEYFKEATGTYNADGAIDARYAFPGTAQNSTPTAEPNDAAGSATQGQYASDDAIPKSQPTDLGSGVLDVASDAASANGANEETETQSAALTASASASASPSASASASASANASASPSVNTTASVASTPASKSKDASSPTMKMLPDTGGIGALPILGLVLVLLGAGSAFRKAL